ncbi:rhodanese-like domain-containing protein [Desulfobacula sp.]
MSLNPIKMKLTIRVKSALVICFVSFFVILSGYADVQQNPGTTRKDAISILPLDAANVPHKKQTVLGLYLTSVDAYKIWKQNSDRIKIVDTRTQGEYIFVGHPAMAFNIPVEFLRLKKPFGYEMQLNKNFVSDIKKRVKETDILFVICRSGNRSVTAVKLLFQAGFKTAYSIIDGFEGDKLKDPGNPDNGKRVVNGWKNARLPWSYHLTAKLIYRP